MISFPAHGCTLLPRIWCLYWKWSVFMYKLLEVFLNSVKTKTWQYWPKRKFLYPILNQFLQRITLHSGCHFKTVYIIATQMIVALDLKFVKWTKTCIAVEDVASGEKERSTIYQQDSLCVHSTERFVNCSAPFLFCINF